MTIKYMGAGPILRGARISPNIALFPFQTTGIVLLGGQAVRVFISSMITPPTGEMASSG